MPTHHLAQLNIAHLADSLESPRLADFVANLDRINALAEAAPGFVWRYTGLSGESAMEAKLFGADHIVNMSVWTEKQSLHNYVYRSAHAEIMAQRKQWFLRASVANQVMWWLPADTTPTLVEAANKLQTLRTQGPTEAAFTFKQDWPAPGV